jgi:hypothetical protein
MDNRTTFTTELLRARVPELESQLARLSKRAVKLGLAPIELRILSEYTKKVELRGVEEVPVIIAAVEISYELVKLAGWQFVAAFDHTPAGNLIRKAPGFRQELPSSFQTAPQACTHCNVTRNRTNTFLVLNEATGEFKQVGRSCLKDFTGHVSPEVLAAWAATFFDLIAEAEDPDSESFGGRSKSFTSISEVLTWVLRSVKANGFRSSKSEYGSTLNHVSNLLFGKHDLHKQDREELEVAYPDAQMEPEVAAILAWADALPEVGLNDYIWNLRVALLNGYLMPKTLGVLCSVTVALENDKARQERKALYEESARKRAEAASQSQYLGAIKERIQFSGEIVFTKYFESDMGFGKFLVVIRDTEGNTIKSFYTGKDGRLCSVGGPYLFKGTVARHSEYKGVKETMVQRLSLEKELAPSGPEVEVQGELSFQEVV